MSSVEHLLNKVSSIEYRIGLIESGVVVPSFVPSSGSSSVDLSGVESKIAALDAKVDSFDSMMKAMMARLEVLEAKSEPAVVDLAPLEARMEVLEATKETVESA